MTLENTIQRTESRFKKIKEYKFSDTLKSAIGEESYSNLKDNLYKKLVEERVNKNKNPNKLYTILKEAENETYYGFTVDAVAQNLTSLIYVLNDKFMAGQSWEGVIGTRINAAVGNTLTGRPYGAWQDYVIAWFDTKFDISNEKNKYKKFFKNWVAKTSAFATGQSWLYGLFLMGGNTYAGEPTDYNELLKGVATLTAFAPLLGPYSDKIYQKIRTKFGLPAIPEYRAKKEKIK